MIKVKITDSMKKRCLDFSKKIISKEDQYNRLSTTGEKQIQRTCAGKIAEYAYLEYVRQNFNSNYPEGDMFEIFEGQGNVDDYDFVDKAGKTYDIKTAFLPNHRNIMIPLDQLKKRKDFYVAVKLNGKFSDLDDAQLVDIGSITTAEIIGELPYEQIMVAQTRDYGYGSNCKQIPLGAFQYNPKKNF